MAELKSALIPLQDFAKLVGWDLKNVTVMKSTKTGRKMYATPAGTLFVAKKLDPKKPTFVSVAGPEVKSSKGESLEGTLWMVNTSMEIAKEDLSDL